MILKLCAACYEATFPGTKARTVTWGRQCSACHKPTPSFATLFKVER